MAIASLIPLLFLSPVAFGPKPTTAAAVVAIRADKLLLSDGRTVDHGVILIDGMSIRAVGAGVEIPAGASIVDHAGYASAGMIALHAYTGAPFELLDDTRPVLDSAELAFGYDPTHPDFESALHAGITTLVLTPPALTMVPGVTTVVKSSGSHIVKRAAQLSVGLSERTLRNDRFPTSLSGALAELDQRFSKREGAFGRATSGKLAILFEVGSKQDVLRACDLAQRHKLTGALFGAPLAGEVASEIKSSNMAVICGPYDAGVHRRELRAVRSLAEAGVLFGFALESPWLDAASLRFSAALCARAGLPAASAWKALTSDAAEIVGVADKVGRLERGLDADIVLWSGDPLDLTSAVQVVYVDGQRVFEAHQ